MLHGSDMIQAGIFFRNFLVESVLGEGHVPQWNPYIFGGMPYVEAFHGDIFYPLSFLKFFGTLHRMLGWVMILHILLAGIFMYLTARQLSLSRIAALVSAGSYMFAHYLVSLVAPGHDGKMFVTALFPLVILFLDRGFEVEGILRKLFEFSLLGLVIGFIILSPHPQMSYYTLWAAAFYTVFRMVMTFRKQRALGKTIIPGAFAAYAVVIGLLLSAIQFYPGYKYTTDYSPRATDDSKSGWEWATSWSLHEEEAFSQLIPEFAGASNREANSYYWGKNYFKDNAETVGIVPIFLALIGLFFYRRPEGYFFGGLGLFAFLYALGATTPIFYIFYYIMPLVKSLRAPSMIMFLFAFSIALLAGMGVQRIRDGLGDLSKKSQQWFSYLLWGLPGFMLFLALAFSVAGPGMLRIWTSIFYSEAQTTMIQQGVSKFDLALMNLPAIQSGAWIGFLFCSLAALLIWMFRSGKAGEWALALLILIPVVDSVRFDKRFVNTFNAESHWAQSALTNFFAQKSDHFRVINFTNLQADFLPYFGVQMVTGYHGNQLRWYDALLGGPGKANQTNPRFLNLVGAEYIMLPANQNLPPGALGPEPLEQAAAFGQLSVVHNPNAFPRVYLVDRHRTFGHREEVYRAVLQGSEDLREIVYLEEEPAIPVLDDTVAVTDSAWITTYDTDSVEVNVELSDNKILVMTDNYFDAWQVTADGEPVDLMRAYGTFRAVALPAGTQQVTFVYKSERYQTGKTITLATSIYLLLVIGGVGLVRLRSNNNKREDEETTA